MYICKVNLKHFIKHMKYTVYLRTNLINGKQYVGQTKNFKEREKVWKCFKAKYAGKLINSARNKYGTDSFETTILKECETQEELNKWEAYYINELNTKVPNGYNLTDGGEGSKGYKMPDEQKEKLKGKHISPPTEFKKGNKPWNTGKHLSEETKNKISESKKGLMAGENNPMYGRSRKEEKYAKLRAKKVYQYTLDGKLVKIWDSASDAARELGYNRGSIKDCCHGSRLQKYKGKTRLINCTQHKGYKWSYKPL